MERGMTGVVIAMAILLPFSLGDARFVSPPYTSVVRSVPEQDRVAVATALREADIVFLGRAVYIIHADTLTGGVPLGATFMVERVWKGQVNHDVSVRESQEYPVRFWPQVEYLVYARTQSGNGNEALLRTQEFAMASTDIAVLDSLAASGGRREHIPALVGGAAIILLALASTGLWRWRRTRRT